MRVLTDTLKGISFEFQDLTPLDIITSPQKGFSFRWGFFTMLLTNIPLAAIYNPFILLVPIFTLLMWFISSEEEKANARNTIKKLSVHREGFEIIKNNSKRIFRSHEFGNINIMAESRDKFSLATTSVELIASGEK